MPLEIDLAGLSQIMSMLSQVADRFPRIASEALRAEAEVEMTEAKKRVPVRTGALRGSGHVTGPTRSGGVVEVRMAFGNSAIDYAVAVHENMEMLHHTGQAKFLESVLVESAPYLAARVAERCQAGAGRDFQPSRMLAAASRQAAAGLGDATEE